MDHHYSSCQILQSLQKILHRLCVAETRVSQGSRHPWLGVIIKMPMKQERRDTQEEAFLEGGKVFIDPKESTLCQAIVDTSNRGPGL